MSRQTSSSTKRQPKGIPVGGQFAESARAEADVEVILDRHGDPIVFEAREGLLASPSDSMYRIVGWENKSLNEHFDASALRTSEEIAESTELVDEDEVSEMIARTANQICSRRGAREHVDDVIGDTAHDIISRIRKNEDPDHNVRAAVTRALISRTVHGHLSHRLANGQVVNTATRMGQARVKKRVAEIEQKENRHVGNTELKRIAAEVRMSFPPGDRPNIDYFDAVNQYNTGSLDEAMSSIRGDSEGGSRADSFNASPITSSGTSFDPTGEAATDLGNRAYEDASQYSTMDAEQMLWSMENRGEAEYNVTAQNASSSVYNVLAQTCRTPPAKTDSIKHHRVLKIRKAVLGSDGGVLAACREYNAGETTERTEALFAPFGDIDNESREDLVDFLNTYPAVANELWDAALKSANTQRKAPEWERAARSQGDVGDVEAAS